MERGKDPADSLLQFHLVDAVQTEYSRQGSDIYALPAANLGEVIWQAVCNAKAKERRQDSGSCYYPSEERVTPETTTVLPVDPD